MANELSFTLKMPDQSFFDEGDVSEVSTLIQVDDEFVLNCADIVRQVSKTIHR